jgi:hypothetical protein
LFHRCFLFLSFLTRHSITFQRARYTGGGATIVTVLAAAAEQLPAGVKIVHAVGAQVTGNSTAGFADAVAAAKAADVVIAVVGDSGNMGWTQNTCGEDDDRTNLDLPGVQSELIAAVAAAVPNTPIVAVLVHGRPVRHQPCLLIRCRRSKTGLTFKLAICDDV